MSKVISIVVTYNGEKWVDRCFGSLIASKGVEHTIFAIDNGSTDHTLELIKTNFPTVEVIETGENLGFGKANNIGLLKAIKEDADFAFLLNQDAWLKDEYVLATLAAQLESNPEIGICSPIQFNSKNSLDLLFENYLKGYGKYTEDILKQGEGDIHLYPLDFVNAASWLISKKCLKRCGGFAPIFQHYGEDKNYADRVKFHKLKMVVCSGVGIIHDRPQELSINLKKNKYQLRLNMMYLSYLMNPNNSILYSIMLLLGMTFVKTSRFIYLKKLSLLTVPFMSLCFVIGILKDVIKQRSRSRLDFAFL